MVRKQADPARELVRQAYEDARSRVDREPTLFEVTKAMEAAAIGLFGPSHQGHRTAPWEYGLSNMGLGTTGDVIGYLEVLGWAPDWKRDGWAALLAQRERRR